jgi:hypothetical protein
LSQKNHATSQAKKQSGSLSGKKNLHKLNWFFVYQPEFT